MRRSVRFIGVLPFPLTCGFRVGGEQKQCLTLCHTGVLTDHNCVCTSPVKTRGKQRWCYVKCPARRESKTQRDWLFRRWDTVTKTKQLSKPASFCIDQTTRDYIKCDSSKRRSSQRVEQEATALALALVALKMISSLRVKAQSSDKDTLHSMSVFAKSFVHKLVDEDRLTAQTADRLLSDINDTMRLEDPGDAYAYFLDSLRDTLNERSDTSNPVLDFVVDHVPRDHLGDFLRGAQIQLDDGGAFYEQIKALSHSYLRISSHHPSVTDVKHVAVNEQVFDQTFHILAGVTPDGETWFQSESSPWPGGITFADAMYSVLAEPRYVADVAGHGLDFLVHKLTHRNIGVLGSSVRGEWDPIKLMENLPASRQQALLVSPSASSALNEDQQQPALPARPEPLVMPTLLPPVAPAQLLITS